MKTNFKVSVYCCA